MTVKYQFDTEDKRQQLINDNNDLILIETQYLSHGNFVLFSDRMPDKRIVYTQAPEQEFNEIKIRQNATDAAVLQLLTEGAI